ncbi:hypothetical protein HMPREF9005_0193 [Actinomyces sp. oral taxon 178 str. F0338]|nr:hypothetical protein HMPREF9005_0193 [Actinomyces sp. oral taxon 178 str. F0338]
MNRIPALEAWGGRHPDRVPGRPPPRARGRVVGQHRGGQLVIGAGNALGRGPASGQARGHWGRQLVIGVGNALGRGPASEQAKGDWGRQRVIGVGNLPTPMCGSLPRCPASTGGPGRIQGRQRQPRTDAPLRHNTLRITATHHQPGRGQSGGPGYSGATAHAFTCATRRFSCCW